MITQVEDRVVVVNGIEVLLRYPAPAPPRDCPPPPPPAETSPSAPRQPLRDKGVVPGLRENGSGAWLSKPGRACKLLRYPDKAEPDTVGMASRRREDSSSSG